MKGFLYYIAGSKHPVQMLVSIASLRRHGNEQPIHIATGDEQGTEWAKRIASEDRLGTITTERIELQTAGKRKRGKKRQHCGKSAMGDWTPFTQTIFLDADTLVAADMSPMWPRPEQIILTNFAKWVTTGGQMKRRLRQFKPVLAEKVAMMTASPYPAINTGVLSWDVHTRKFHNLWKEIALNFLIEDDNVFMGDEIVANLIFPDFCHQIQSDLWNFSPHYSVESRGGEFDPSEVKVWHYHGGKHCRPGPAIESWWPGYEYVIENNFAGVQDWTPANDESLKLELSKR